MPGEMTRHFLVIYFNQSPTQLQEEEDDDEGEAEKNPHNQHSK